MPSCPMAMPSHTAMVLNSSGVPPAISTPSLTARATLSRCTWPGTTSLKELAMPISGRRICPSDRPAALSSERCGARWAPSFMMFERILLSLSGFLRGGVRALPAHLFAQIGAGGLQQAGLGHVAQGIELRAAGLVFQNPAAGKTAVLNLR